MHTPASAGPPIAAVVPRSDAERRHRRQILHRDELRRERLERRRVKPVHRRHERRDDEEERHARVREHRVDGERERAAEQQRLATEQQAPPIDRVRECAAPERRHRERDELHGAEQPDDRGRLREIVDLHGQRDVREEAAERAHELAREDEAEVPVPAERSEV